MRKGTRGWHVLTLMAAVLPAAFMSFAGVTRTVTTVEELVQALNDLKDDAENTVILAPSSEPYDVSGCAMLCNDADKAKYLWSTSHIAISKLTLRGGGQTARDTVIFDLLLKDLPKPERFHRQNHFFVMAVPEKSPLVNAVIPAYPGAIQLELNAVKYDFRKLPIDYVVTANREWAAWLARNPGLRELPRCGAWSRFLVVH